MNNIEILYNILMNDDIVFSINDNLDILLIIIPELRFEIGFEHKHPHHHLDVWDHTLLALSMSEKNFDIRLSLLLHDIGKPFCFTEIDGIRHFTGHPVISKEITKEILVRLGFHPQMINEICFLVLKHDSLITKTEMKQNIELIKKLYEIQKCDALAHHPDKLEKRKKYLKRIKERIDSYKN